MWLEKKGEGGKGEEGRCVTSGTWGSEEITAVAECNGIRRIKGLQIEDNALGSDAREGLKLLEVSQRSASREWRCQIAMVAEFYGL